MFVEHKEAGEAQKTPLEILKLSEAIRIGAKLRPQGRNVFLNDAGESCAMGAAAEAIYGDLKNLTHKQWMAVNGKAPNHFIIEVFHRNDRGESRESIADWLEAQGY